MIVLTRCSAKNAAAIWEIKKEVNIRVPVVTTPRTATIDWAALSPLAHD